MQIRITNHHHHHDFTISNQDRERGHKKGNKRKAGILPKREIRCSHAVDPRARILAEKSRGSRKPRGDTQQHVPINKPKRKTNDRNAYQFNIKSQKLKWQH